MNVSNYLSLCIEISKTLNDINRSSINDIFKLRMTNRPTQEKYKLNPEIPKSNQLKSGTKSLRYLGLKVCNSLQYHIKSSENLAILRLIKKLERNSLHMQDMQKVKLHFPGLFCHSN